MIKDKALEEMFLAQKPVFDDKDDFMRKLTAKLDAVEYLRNCEEADMRRYKLALVVVFAVGVITGGVVLALVWSMPEAPLFTFNVSTELLLTLEQHSRMIVLLALALLVSFGTISIVTNTLDMARLNNRLTVKPRAHNK